MLIASLVLYGVALVVSLRWLKAGRAGGMEVLDRGVAGVARARDSAGGDSLLPGAG